MIDLLHNSFKYILFLSLLIFYNFTVYVSFIPTYLQQLVYYFMPIVCVVYLLFFKHIGRCVNKYIVLSVFFLFLSFLWGMVTMALNGSDDISYFLKLMSVFRNVAFAILFGLLIRKYYTSDILVKFSELYIVSILICVLSTIFFIINYDMRFIIQNHLVSSSTTSDLIAIENYVTRFCFKGFTGFSDTIICSFGMVFSYFLIKKNCFLGYLGVIFSFLGVLFYGRIGLILFFLYIIYFLIVEGRIKYLLYMIILCCVIVLFMNSIENPLLIKWLDWLLSPLESFINGLHVGQLNFGGSADKLIYQMYFPIDDRTLLFGDGRYTNLDNSYYMHTDAGFMRILLYGGIPMMLLVYSSFLCMCISAYKNLSMSSKCRKSTKWIVFPIIIAFFISEYKGDPYAIYFYIITVLSLPMEEDARNGGC